MVALVCKLQSMKTAPARGSCGVDVRLQHELRGFRNERRVGCAVGTYFGDEPCTSLNERMCGLWGRFRLILDKGVQCEHTTYLLRTLTMHVRSHRR